MANALIDHKPLTLEEFMTLAASERFEIIAGEKTTMPAAGVTHALYGANWFRFLDRYLQVNDLGVVLADGVTYLMHSPASGLKDAFEPDVSFIRHDNIPVGWDAEKPHPGAPDLAIEIVSPSNNAAAMQYKRWTYLDRGTQLVALMYPRLREVHLYTAQATHIISEDGSLDLSALFPGIEALPVAALFKVPPWAEPK